MNKKILSEIMTYLVSRGVSLTDIMNCYSDITEQNSKTESDQKVKAPVRRPGRPKRAPVIIEKDNGIVVETDVSVTELCKKLGVKPAELKEMIETGGFPKADRGNKWSAEILSKHGVKNEL